MKRFFSVTILLVGLSIAGVADAQLPTPTVSFNQPASIDEDLTVLELAGDRSSRLPVKTSLDDSDQPFAESDLADLVITETRSLLSREGSGNSVKLVLLLGALSLAPAILLMTTCYIRIIVVLTLLRQAFGGQQLPPNQVLTALSLFLTLLVMSPVWNEVKRDAIDPYASSESAISWQQAWETGIRPVKRFMSRQIEIAKNTNAIGVFYKYHVGQEGDYPPPAMEDVPITVLLPAFIISELKVAFLLGFQILLPFLVLDFVVSTVTVSMGMLMLPPTMVSFPLKLILFVMVDGWNMVIGMLLQSFGSFV